MTAHPPRHAGAATADDPALVDTGREVVVELTGRLDALRALSLRAQLDELVVQAVTRVRDVLVDLGAVDFVDSAALAALVRLRRQCADAGLDLALVKPRDASALRIFRLTQFDEVFVMLDGRPR